MRLNLRVVDDTKSTANSIILPKSKDPGIGRSFYLNHEVDQAQAQVRDSDQDMDTDDGVSAEEELKINLECPLAVITEDMWGNKPAASEETPTIESRTEHDCIGICFNGQNHVRHGRSGQTLRNQSQDSRFRLQERKRCRETHPLKPIPLPFNDRKEGVERLAANSFAPPMGIGKDAVQSSSFDPKDPSVVSMNERTKSRSIDLHRLQHQLEEHEERRVDKIKSVHEFTRKSVVITSHRRYDGTPFVHYENNTKFASFYSSCGTDRQRFYRLRSKN